MKRIAAITVALALFIIVLSAAQAAGAATATTKTMTSVQSTGSHVYVVSGNVFVSQGSNPAHRVINNEAIVSDTVINTGEKSSALLRFEDGQIVTMQGNSTFQVREYRYDARLIQKSSIVFSMFKGGMRFITGLIGQQSKQAFRLLSPNATIGIRGTEFMVTMAGNSMYSHVLTGKISMTNAAGSTDLGAGQFAVLASSTALASVVSASAIPSGTFSELLSIPVDPSAIIAPVPAPIAVPVPVVPVPLSAPALAPAAKAATTGMAGAAVGAGVVAVAGVSGATTDAGAGATVAGASLGVAGGALAGKVGGNADSKPGSAQTISAADNVPKPTESAKADDQNEMGSSSKSGKSVTAKIGTLGYGVELNVGYSDIFSTRFGLNVFAYKYNANASAMNYDFKLQLQTASVLADWYPFAGSFRTSGGLFYNNNKVSFSANPTGGNFIVNGVTYTSAQIGSLQGTATFNQVAPYFGVGWGNPVAKGKGWGLVSDIGLLYQGKPKVDLVATCTSPTICTQLQTDAAAENAKLQNELRHFRWWPVISTGISYQW
jgi:hypothetical protein